MLGVFAATILSLAEVLIGLIIDTPSDGSQKPFERRKQL